MCTLVKQTGFINILKLALNNLIEMQFIRGTS